MSVAPVVPRSSKSRELVRRCDWLFLIAIAPFIFFLDVRFTWVLLAIPLVLLVQGWAWGKFLPITPLNPAILLLEIMVGVNMVVTPDLTTSLGKIGGLLFGVAVYFCVANHARTEQGLKESLILLFLAGMGVALLGLISTNWGTTKNLGLNALTARLPVRLEGLPGAEAGIQPNELAGALLWVIPAIFMASLVLVRKSEWFTSKVEKYSVRLRKLSAWTIFLIVAFLLEMGVLVLSQSRGGYLAIALTGLILMILIPKWPRRWWAIGMLVVVGVGGVILVQQIGWETIRDQVLVNLPADTSAFSLNSISMRVEIWSRAIWAIKDVPLTGMGMNIFRSGVFILYPTFQVSAGYSLGHAHNELLQAALDLGLPGLVGFLAIYIGAMGMLVQTIRSGGTLRLLALGLLGGLLAHFLFGITDAVALGAKPGFLFWWLLGMTFGLYEQSRSVKVV